jgi:hypothetical protein
MLSAHQHIQTTVNADLIDDTKNTIPNMQPLDQFVDRLSELTATSTSTIQHEARKSIDITLFRKSGSLQRPIETDTELRKLIQGLERLLAVISKHKSGMFIRQTQLR